MAANMSARFWPPAAESATEMVCAYFETSDGPPHLHEEWQFGIAEHPSKLSLGAFRRRDVQEDDITVVPPFEVHSEEGERGAAARWRMLYVPPTTVRRLAGDRLVRVVTPVVRDRTAARALRVLLCESADGLVTGEEFQRRVTEWLAQFMGQHASPAPPRVRVPPVERARSYLQDRPTQSVTFREIGAVAGVTVNYLVRSFSKEVGLPPQTYHAQVRLARARRLLAEGRPASWVAYECKFSDQAHLTRRFKEYHGVTPGAFQSQWTGT